MLGALTALAGLELKSAMRRNIHAGLLFFLAGIFMVAAAAYGLSAVHVLLAARYGEIDATLMIGAGLLLCAIVSVALALYVRRRRSPTAARTAAMLVAAPVATGLLRNLAPSVLKVAPLMLIAGIVAGRYITRK